MRQYLDDDGPQWQLIAVGVLAGTALAVALFALFV